MSNGIERGAEGNVMVPHAQQTAPRPPAGVTPPSEERELRSNIYVTAGGDAYILEIPVAGLENENIAIEATVGTVTVSTRPRASAPESGSEHLRRERLSEPMSRVFEFPTEIDTDNVRASLENGVLRVHVPKAIAARRNVIHVT